VEDYHIQFKHNMLKSPYDASF